MTNQEAINNLILIEDHMLSKNKCEHYQNLVIDTIETAIAALAGGPIKIEVTEYHAFAKPEDTSGLKFGD